MSRPNILSIAILSFGLAAVGTSCYGPGAEEDTPSGCSDNSECKGTRICNADGECVDPSNVDATGGTGDGLSGGDGWSDGSDSGGTGDSGTTGGMDTDDTRDSDSDGFPDDQDNCPNDANPQQGDADMDSVGDVCDNCRNVANVQQTDSDSDGTGNACEDGASYDPDRDRDGDGEDDVDDNCIDTPNSSQIDSDNDRIGDACDNCPDDANYQQLDADSDGTGDACESQPAGSTCDSDSFSVGGSSGTPGLYFLVDESGSMGTNNRMQDVENGLHTFFMNKASTTRIGLTPFSDQCSPSELINIGTHTSSFLTSTYTGRSPTGSTATGGALDTVDSDARYGSTTPRAVVLITDGDANICGGSNYKQYAVQQARQLHNDHGVDIYVIGFDFSGDTTYLNNLAQAGGTGSPRMVNDSTSLDNELDSIRSSVAGPQKRCTFSFSLSSSAAENKMWVEFGTTSLSESHFTYDSTRNELQLDSSACTQLRNSSATRVTITAGCDESCQSSGSESCNYEDDDCDGSVDETCTSCSPEVCDGQNNDCDTKTDEGCP